MSVEQSQEHYLRGVGFLKKQAGVLHVEGPVLTGRGAVHFRSAQSEEPAPPQKLSLLDPRRTLAPEPHCQ